MGHLDKIISHLYIYIYEKSVNSDDKQFHQPPIKNDKDLSERYYT